MSVQKLTDTITELKAAVEDHRKAVIQAYIELTDRLEALYGGPVWLSHRGGKPRPARKLFEYSALSDPQKFFIQPNISVVITEMGLSVPVVVISHKSPTPAFLYAIKGVDGLFETENELDQFCDHITNHLINVLGGYMQSLVTTDEVRHTLSPWGDE